MNLFLKIYTLVKLPLISFINPKVIKLTESQCQVRIPLGYRTRNHLKVMYFGALAVGAELSIAIKAVEVIKASGKRVDFLFKDFKAEFLKRADGDVVFHCDEAQEVQRLIDGALTTSDRRERTFVGYATVPSKGPEPVMKYHLTLSVKNRSPVN